MHLSLRRSSLNASILLVARDTTSKMAQKYLGNNDRILVFFANCCLQIPVPNWQVFGDMLITPSGAELAPFSMTDWPIHLLERHLIEHLFFLLSCKQLCFGSLAIPQTHENGHPSQEGKKLEKTLEIFFTPL